MKTDARHDREPEGDFAAEGPSAAAGPSELQPEDFYFEGAYLVFTEAYHRKRGYCCNSDCRHCPYR